MHRLRLMLLPAVHGRVCRGLWRRSAQCPGLRRSETNADFSKKTADMMKNANTGMDLKKAKADGAASPK